MTPREQAVRELHDEVCGCSQPTWVEGNGCVHVRDLRLGHDAGAAAKLAQVVKWLRTCHDDDGVAIFDLTEAADALERGALGEE